MADAACVGVGVHNIGLIVNDGIFVADDDNIDDDGLSVFNINCFWRPLPQVHALMARANKMPARPYPIRH